MPKRSIGLTIFGAIFILLGMISAISPFIAYIKFSELGIIISAVDDSMNVYPLGLQYFLIIFVAPLALAGAVSYIITGIGILRLRYWGWYLAMAAVFSKLFSLANPGFIFGWQAIGLFSAVIQLGFLIFVFSFFRRRKIKEQFALHLKRFSFKNWYGIIVIFYLILPLAIPLTAVAFKTSLKLKPAKRPQRLEFKEGVVNLAGAKRREIFNLSFLAPQDFLLSSFDKMGTCMLRDSSPEKKGLITVWEKTILDDPTGMYKRLKFKNIYEFDKALYLNSWSIGLLILQKVARPSWYDGQILIFETPQIKGFIIKGEELVYDCSIYDKNNRSIGNFTLALNSKYFTKEDALKIISSLKMLNKPQAAEYYQRGLKYLNEGDMVSAQMAFAQAYYLSSQNAEYAYRLAKTLTRDDVELIKKISEEALKLKPDYFEARSLLEMLNKKK